MRFWIVLVTFVFLSIATVSPAAELTKVPFPYGPLGLNSIPWIVAKDARLFEKNGIDVDMVYIGIDVDMVYIGASSVMVQSMLAGSANIAGFAGPAVIANVLNGGDIVQIAAMAPYFTQSVIARPEIRDLRSLSGKKVGVTRFGSVTDLALRALLDRNGIQDVTVLQMRGFGEAVAGLSRRAIDAAVLSPPHTFRMITAGFRELVGPKELKALGTGFLTQGIAAKRTFGSTHRELVAGVIRATVEGTKYAIENEDYTKRLIGRYLSISDPELLRQSYRYVAENFVKEPFVPESTVRSMVD